MPDQAGESVDERVRAGLAFVCGRFDDLVHALGEDDPDLIAVRAAVCGGSEVRAVLDRLHVRLRAQGDVLGVYGQASRSTPGAIGLPGIRDEPGESVYACGNGLCDRYVWLVDAVAPPVCSFTGATLATRRVG